MALTFLLHIPQVHILSECCDRTDRSACASSGKMAPLLMTSFSLLQAVIPGKSEITFSHIFQTLRFDIFKCIHLCVYMYKCIKFHQFMTNKAINDIHGHLGMYFNSHTVSHGITDERARREFVRPFSPSLQMSFNTSMQIWQLLGHFRCFSSLLFKPFILSLVAIYVHCFLSSSQWQQKMDHIHPLLQQPFEDFIHMTFQLSCLD